MIPQQNEISSPPFKKMKLPVVNNNTTLITSNNKETSSVTTYNKNILKLKQFELFKILSFLTNERNSIITMLCLNKTIFNEIFNEESLQENIKHFILRNENNFITIILSLVFNYNLNLFVNNEIHNTLQKLLQIPKVQSNKENVFEILQNYLNNNLYNNTITKNVDFYCNDGEEQFSNDTMIYKQKDDDFLQFEFNLQKSKINGKRICHSSLQNENYLLFSNLKNTLNRLRNCFDFLTCHIQSLQSYFYKRKQWSTWLNELSNRYKENSEMLQNIQHELNTKIFDKVNFVKVKKNDMLDFHIYITKYKIGENLEFNYNDLEKSGNSVRWSLKYKVYNFTNYNDHIFTLIESDTNDITINLQNLHKIKTILQINNKLVSDELLIEAILISCPQWNLLEFIENDFEITNISFDDNEIITTTYDNEEENNDDDDEDSDNEEEEENKTIKDIGTFTIVVNQKQENKFTITDLPVELLNYICNYLFYLKDGLSLCLTSKDIYNSIYYNNNLFNANKIIKNNIIPLIMTTIYNKFNEQKLMKNKECDNSTKEQKNDFYFNLSFSNYIGDLNQYNNFYFKLFLTILKRVEHFIGYIDSLQRYIYVKQFEFNNFLKEINNNYIAQQLNDKIFKKLIYQSSQINALDDQWCYKALYNINNCIYFEQKVRMDHVDPILYCNIKIMNDNNNFLEFKEIYEYENDLLEEIDEKQLRKYLDLEDERITIDLIFECLKYCSPFKFEFIEYCEEIFNIYNIYEY
ncbi:hypothetical protein ABK040_010553 [Willaertia magna]